MTEQPVDSTDLAALKPASQIVIWDWPVRLCHWLFVALLPALYFSWKLARMDLHILFGETMLGVVLFRLLWGVFGSQTARLAALVRKPNYIRAYLRGSARPAVVGHNPLGGWSVLAMLAVLGLQVSLGLVATDSDGLYSGPLSGFVSFEVSETAAEWHEWLFNLILGLVTLHLAAISYYAFVRRDNLVRPMVSGTRDMRGIAQPRLGRQSVAIACAAFAIGLVAWISSGVPPL